MGGEAHGKAADFWRALISLLAHMEPLHLRRASLRAVLIAPVLYTLDFHSSSQDRQASPAPLIVHCSMHTKPVSKCSHELCPILLMERLAATNPMKSAN